MVAIATLMMATDAVMMVIGAAMMEHARMMEVDITCQMCKIHGHSSHDCWWRNQDNSDSDDDRNDKEKGAHAAYKIDTNWYTDSGATQHLTGEFNKLSVHERYKGHDRVHTAEGTGMSYW
jgi:hypothetical protein